MMKILLEILQWKGFWNEQKLKLKIFHRRVSYDCQCWVLAEIYTWQNQNQFWSFQQSNKTDKVHFVGISPMIISRDQQIWNDCKNNQILRAKIFQFGLNRSVKTCSKIGHQFFNMKMVISSWKFFIWEKFTILLWQPSSIFVFRTRLTISRVRRMLMPITFETISVWELSFLRLAKNW